MPHTVAHPAAVLPLFGLRRLPASALVIGSVAPDLAYHVPFEVTRAQSHAFAGVLWFALPAGLFAYLAFHAWVAPLLAECAPPVVAARLPPRWRRGALPRAPGAWVALAILLGALTHVTWDAFTHAGDPGVRAVPWLAEPLLHVGEFALRPYKLLQHGGSLLGVTALALVAARGWQRASTSAVDARERAPDAHAAGGARAGSHARVPAPLSPARRRALGALVLLPPTALVLRALWQVVVEPAGVVHAVDHVFTVASFDATTALLAAALGVGALRRVLRHPLSSGDPS